MEVKPIPRIGIGVIAENADGLILLGKRKNAHGEGCWGPPGGHLEFGETPIECGMRELREETGLSLHNPREIAFTNDIFKEYNKHYISIFIHGYIEGECQLLEPEKCAEWQWFSWSRLPEPLFLPLNTLVKNAKKTYK